MNAALNPHKRSFFLKKLYVCVFRFAYVSAGAQKGAGNWTLVHIKSNALS